MEKMSTIDIINAIGTVAVATVVLSDTGYAVLDGLGTISGIVFGITSAFFAWSAWRLSKKTVSMSIVAEYLQVFHADKEMQEAFRDIENGQYLFGALPYQDRGERLLLHFSSLAQSWENGDVKKDDLGGVKYYLIKTLSNKEVKKNIIDSQNNGTHQYRSLVNLGESLGIPRPTERDNL